jgi:hypothetical protein
MDIEQLKLILESLDNVTDGARTIAVWWIVGKTLLPIIGWSMMLTALIIVVKTGARLIFHHAQDTQALLRIATNKGLSTIGGNYITNGERTQLERQIEKIINNQITP